MKHENIALEAENLVSVIVQAIQAFEQNGL